MTLFLPVLLWAQATTVGDLGMPTLGTIISAFAGVGILYIIKLVIASDKKMDGVNTRLAEFWTALYGVKDAAELSGLIHDFRETNDCLSRLTNKFDSHVAKEEGMWLRFEENIATSNSRTHGLYLGIQQRMEALEGSVRAHNEGGNVVLKEKKPRK
jgi:hypothetical protein